MKTIMCAIYKGSKKYDSYLYIENEGDFSFIPDALHTMMGDLEFIMELELTSIRKLAGANVTEVMQQLEQQGYYLQMPLTEVDRLVTYGKKLN